MAFVSVVHRHLPFDHRVDVTEFGRVWEQMVEDEELSPEARLELIDGEIYEMPTIGPPHNYGVLTLSQLLMTKLVGRAVVSVQGPLDCGRWSQPLPDVTVAEPPLKRYVDHVATGRELLWAIEVADATLSFDRRRKLPIYARSGVPEVWLVDVRGRRVEVYVDRHDLGYGTLFELGPADLLAPGAFPDMRFTVAELFPGYSTAASAVAGQRRRRARARGS